MPFGVVLLPGRLPRSLSSRGGGRAASRSRSSYRASPSAPSSAHCTAAGFIPRSRTKPCAGHAIAGASSSAEYDHHAFLYWPATKLAVVPLTLYDGNGPPFTGAIGLRVERTGIDEVGRVEHPHDDEALWDVQRATVIGDRLFTLSSAGVLSSALDTLAAGPFVSFPDRPPVFSGCDGGPIAARQAGDKAIACPVASTAPAG